MPWLPMPGCTGALLREPSQSSPGLFVKGHAHTPHHASQDLAACRLWVDHPSGLTIDGQANAVFSGTHGGLPGCTAPSLALITIAAKASAPGFNAWG